MVFQRILPLAEISLKPQYVCLTLKSPAKINLLPGVLKKFTNGTVGIVNFRRPYTVESVIRSPHSTTHVDVACI